MSNALALRSRPTFPATKEWAATVVLSRLAHLSDGFVRIEHDGEVHDFGDPRAPEDLRATIYVRDARAWEAILLSGNTGAGEAYAAGWWTADDLTRALRILFRNQHALRAVDGGLAKLATPLRRIAGAMHRNTHGGSRRNIAAHYDLSNDFFALLLDPSMTYSSAIYRDEDATLAEAQLDKLDRICRKLDLGPGDRVLEIGCGWGSFAIHAATHYGCRVTATTISREQHALAEQRIREAGLEDRVELLLCDYRDLEGRYDKIVSIEMIEAVGHEYYDTFFAKCSELLTPRGMMLIQTITIRDDHYDRQRKSMDFIKKHIFPGSVIPSVSALLSAGARSTDMRLFDFEDIGPHYARTLQEWHDNLLRNEERIRELGYDDRFMWTWELYLCSCAAGFAERHLGNAHMLFVKPECRREVLDRPLGSWGGSEAA